MLLILKLSKNGFERSPKELYKGTLSRIITNIHLWNGPISKIFFIYTKSDQQRILAWQENVQEALRAVPIADIHPQISLEVLFTRVSSLYYWQGSLFFFLLSIYIYVLLNSRLHV